MPNKNKYREFLIIKNSKPDISSVWTSAGTYSETIKVPFANFGLPTAINSYNIIVFICFKKFYKFYFVNQNIISYCNDPLFFNKKSFEK